MMHVEVFKGGGKHPYYMRLKAGNGQTVATSEGYSTKQSAVAAAKKAFPGFTLRILDSDDTA